MLSLSDFVAYDTSLHLLSKGRGDFEIQYMTSFDTQTSF